MMAFEAKRESILSQYDEMMERIRKQTRKGEVKASMLTEAILPEVAAMLAKDGYDVSVKNSTSPGMSYSKVSWRYAKEGRRGELLYDDELSPNLNLDLDELLLAIMPRSEDCGESSKNT